MLKIWVFRENQRNLNKTNINMLTLGYSIEKISENLLAIESEKIVLQMHWDEA